MKVPSQGEESLPFARQELFVKGASGAKVKERRYE